MRVHYVLKRYPRLSETFIVREIAGIEALGADVAIDALLPPEDGPRHAEVARVRADVRYVSRRPRWADADVRRAAAVVVAHHPSRFAAEAARAVRSGDRRRFRQAVLVAARAIEQRADVLHAHFATAAAQVAVPAARLAGVPVTVTAHAKDIFHEEHAPHVAARLARVDRVVTVSGFNVAHLHGVLDHRRITHVANGVALGPPAGVHIADAAAPVLCVARLVEKKGIDTLLDAIALLSPRDPALRLEVIGDGPLRGELETRAERLGVAERVRFAGACTSDEVETAYARCSVVALACRVTGDGDRDGLPTVLVEAMARALPVVATAVVGIPELVRHGETGLLVAPDDPAALAAAIDRLRTDPLLAAGLAAAGRRHVQRAYDPGTSARRLLGVWESLGHAGRVVPLRGPVRPVTGVGVAP